MPDTTNPRREQSNTYIVQDRSNREELARLQVQDDMITSALGILSEQADPAGFQRILDVGCGTGGWLIEVAKAYPGIMRPVGVDVSGKMVEYARTQAIARHVADRAEFHVMDVLRTLEFPNDYFDLVNLRFGTSYLRIWDWPRLLQEFQRIIRPGGIIRVTESDNSAGNSPALTRLNHLLEQAFFQGGHLFLPESNGIGKDLAHLLQRHGLQNVQEQLHIMEYRAGTVEGQHFYTDVQHLFRTIVPFLRKWTRLPDDYEEIYQQALNEIEQPNFSIKWRIFTAWGERPARKETLVPEIP